jgi:hypothetical protein
MGEENENEKAEVGDERRKDIFELMVALGVVVALKGVMLIVDLATIFK